MRHRWPEDTRFTRVVLEVEDNVCAVCGGALHICDHRQHRIFTLQGPVEVVCTLAHCSDRHCAAHTKTRSPYAETTLTLPWWLIGWDVFCWMGHRRFARHWSVPQIRSELADSYQIPLSADAIEDAVRRYQTMLAARQQDPQVVAAAYRNVEALVLSIDGLQPEKGHETLYVVRELNAKRIWFAEALLSSHADEVRRLLSQARAWATQLGLPVHLWLSDKQDAFVTGIAVEFPGVPHRYCVNHFLRDLAKPMLETDRHAKVKMRRKVRGLRAIEREILQPRQRLSAEVPAVAPVTVSPVPPHQRTRWPRTSPSRRNHRRMPARSGWMTGVPCVVFSLTIRGDRYKRPADAWRRPWETSVRLSNATSRPTVTAARTPNASAWPDVATAAWPRCRQNTTSSVSNGKRSSVSPQR
jgi:hypothetical protein